MRMFWTLQIGIAAAALAGFAVLGVACGSSSTGGTDTDTDVLTDTGTDTAVETDTDTSDTDTSTTDSGCDCACTGTMAAGQCGNICSTLLNGATSPNFCEGQAPLSQCAACLAANCASVSTSAGTCSGM